VSDTFPAKLRGAHAQAARAGGSVSLVALPPVRVLLLCAKHLFIAASWLDFAATPVQVLRFRANDLRADAYAARKIRKRTLTPL
jgi:hypothetical protein